MLVISFVDLAYILGFLIVSVSVLKHALPWVQGVIASMIRVIIDAWSVG